MESDYFRFWKPSIRDYYNYELSKRELIKCDRTEIVIFPNNIRSYRLLSFDTDIVYLSNDKRLEFILQVFHGTLSKDNFNTSFSINLEIHPRLISLFHKINEHLNIRHLSAIIMSYITDNIYYLSLDHYIKIITELYEENNKFGLLSHDNICLVGYYRFETEEEFLNYSKNEKEHKLVTSFRQEYIGRELERRHVIDHITYPTEEIELLRIIEKFDKYDNEYNMYEEFDYLYDY